MQDLAQQLESVLPYDCTGSVVGTIGATAVVRDLSVPLGAQVKINRTGAAPVMGEVIGFDSQRTLVSPLGDMAGIRRGDRVRLVHSTAWLRVGHALLGRVVNAHGQAIDDRPRPAVADRVPLHRQPPRPADRPRIENALGTGVRAIDGLLPCGRGQRVGIFAGSGVGKSVLLGMMARNTAADVNVIALVGERGREVREFVERDLGPAGMMKSVVVVSTSDEPAVVRVRAALAATAIAEYFRDQGKDVLLVVDSVTRVAQAQREIGLAAGEPPTTRGYPPSMFATLPKLLERAGRTTTGSITGFYSVLVEGDDANEPVSDTIRGLLDGHIRLSRRLAAQGHYPAIDVLESVSRLSTQVSTSEHQAAMRQVRQWLSNYREHEDLISIGAYRSGANAVVDAAIAMKSPIEKYLQQPVDQPTARLEAVAQLAALANGHP